MPPHRRQQAHFDPLQFLCKQAAGDFNSVFSCAGETSKEKNKVLDIKGSWDPSARFKLHRVSGEAPAKTQILFHNQHELVAIIPEGQSFSSEFVRGIVIRDMLRFHIYAINAEHENEPAFVRLEGDLYGAGELLSY